MQSVVEITGELRLRDESTLNPRIATGEVELKATSLVVLSEAQPLPYDIDDSPRVR